MQQPAGRPRRTFLLVRDVAAELRVYKSTVYRWIGSGALPAIRVGVGRGTLRIERDAFEEFLKRSKESAAKAEAA